MIVIFNILPIQLYEYKYACQSCLFKISKNNISNFIHFIKKHDEYFHHYDMEHFLYIYVTTISSETYKTIDILGMTALPSDRNEQFDV